MLTDGRTDGRTNMTKLIVAFHNFVNVSTLYKQQGTNIILLYIRYKQMDLTISRFKYDIKHAFLSLRHTLVFSLKQLTSFH